MPQDLLQIALEHHRAGRLRQAEAGYRAIAGADPDNPDAAHWLGVLSFQAGRVDEAIPLLERAAALRPADPAFQYNLAQACMSCGRFDQAIDALEKAARLDPQRVDTLMMLGRARLNRQAPGDALAAVDTLKRARDLGLNSAEVHHYLGVALLAAKLPDEAVEPLRASLSLKSENATAYHHLAMAYRLKGEHREVRKNLNKALELDPGLARAWYDLATLDANSGNTAVAAGLFRKAVAAKSDFAAAWNGLGSVLLQLGKNEEAARAFEQAGRGATGREPVAAEGAEPATIADLERKLASSDALTLHFALASRYPVFTPVTLPRPSLSDLFDRYAPSFDESLVEKLHYRVPEQIAEAVAAARPGTNAKPIDILDLGCGTGLCGRLLRPLAGRLCGVDLSAGMIEKARERGVYDQLDVGELMDVMKRSPRSFDLVIAADVFIYVGDLGEVFEAAAACLRPGGLFIFSVEAGGGDRYNLTMKIRRYTHSAPYLRRLAAMCGFEELSFAPVVIRMEKNKIVPGYLPVLRYPGA
jgi:predicted TPR repeat methyltransferase